PSTSHSASPLHASTPPSFSHITPHIAIADLAFAENPDLLKREGVTHVVSVLSDRGESHIPAHIPPSNRLHVPLDDAPFAELVGLLGPVVQWVEDALRDAGNTHIRILIHCAHGISRSPAVGAALLVA
ncbi:protein-tyrosine phosphatase-like protein, partial [Mycena capillaripes]